MRVEASLIEKTGQGFCELPKTDNTNKKKNKNKKKKKNRSNRKETMTSVVQKLFETCKEVFGSSVAGIVPPSSDIERLRLILDAMKPEDVGLTEDMPYFKTVDSKGGPPITYLHIFECNKFLIGIFCFPPSAVIPLHNHPGMTVFSKLLFGSMHIKSYDWVPDLTHNTNDSVKPSYFQPPGCRLARVKVDSVFTAPCNTSILYPAAGGNMHSFTALTSCAVLDVLGPPYSDPEGRHCTYYRDFPYTSLSGEPFTLKGEDERHGGFAWLEEREKPENFVVVGALYKGPRILTN